MLNSGTADRYIITSGGHTKTVINSGMAVITKYGELRVEIKIRATAKAWKTGVTISPDQWCHLIVTWTKDGALTLYIDGTQEASVGAKGFTPSTATTSSSMTLGRPSGLSTKYGEVSMDDWFFWNYPLKPEEVETIYELCRN